MKKELSYIIILFLSGIIHLLVFLVSWSKEQGKDFIPLLLLLIISFSLNILLFLIATGWMPYLNLPAKNQKEEKKDNNPQKMIDPAKEVIDPKSSVDKLFKHVLLKRSYKDFGEKLLSNFSAGFEIVQGIFYVLNEENGKFEKKATFAIPEKSNIRNFISGETIPGQAALKNEVTILKNIPENFRSIESGLGVHSPAFMYFIPFILEKKTIALLEISTFKELSKNKLNILHYFMSVGGKKLDQFAKKVHV